MTKTKKAERTRIINYLLRNWVRDDDGFNRFIESIKVQRLKHGYYSAQALEALKHKCVFLQRVK